MVRLYALRSDADWSALSRPSVWFSRAGVIPLAHSHDTAGPMARTVADAAIFLGALVGKDKRDSITSNADKGQKDYTKFLDKNGLKGARLGVTEQYVNPKSKLAAIAKPHLQALKDAGATLVDVEFQTPAHFRQLRLEVFLYEFKADLNKYLADRKSPYKTLAELIKFNNENREKEMPIFGQELFLQAEAKGDLTDSTYTRALNAIKQATQVNGIDAVVAKT